MTQNIGIAQDKLLTADKKGRFAIQLPPGAYDVFITAPGFEPTCEKLGAFKNQTIQDDVKLKVSTGEVIHLD